MNELSELVEYLTWSDFRITFDTTSNGIFRATVSHPSGKMQTFIGGVSAVADVLKGR